MTRGEYIRGSSTSKNYVRRNHRPRATSPRETGDTDPVLATGVCSIDDDDLTSEFTTLAQKVLDRSPWLAPGLIFTDGGPHLPRPPSPTQTVESKPSDTGRVAVQPSRPMNFSQLLSTKAAKSQWLKGRDDIPSSLCMVIDLSALAKEMVAGIAAFTSVRPTLPVIRVGFLPVHVDRSPANVCRTR